MKLNLLACFLICYSFTARGQLRTIDTVAIASWKRAETGKISNNGKYTSYNVTYLSNGNISSQDIIIQGVDNHWKFQYHAPSINLMFTTDSKRALFLLPGDSLVDIKLGTDIINYITHVSSFSINNNSIITSLTKNGQKSINFKSLDGKIDLHFDSTQHYSFNDLTEKLFIIKGSNPKELYYIDVKKNKQSLILKSDEIENIVFDKSGRKIAFTCQRNKDKSIFIFDLMKASLNCLLSEKELSSDSSLQIGGIKNFTDDSQNLLFTINNRANNEVKVIDHSNVEVWNSNNARLKSQKFTLEDKYNDWISSINIVSKKVIRLEKENISFIGTNNEYALMRQRAGIGTFSELDWNPASQLSHFLISLKDGSTTPLKGNWLRFSRHGRFIIYFDTNDNNYYTYELATGTTYNITRGLATKWQSYQNDNLDSASAINIDRSYWFKDDKSLLMPDRFDIWKLDPTGKTPPINLTNHYGQKNNIKFFPLYEASDEKLEKDNQGKILLSAFNYTNKENGYYYLKLGKSEDPQKLTMGPYAYFVMVYGTNFGWEIPKKSVNKDTYLLQRMSATSSPNFFITTDFNSFSQISNVNPEKEYNWLTTELYNWRAYDGKTAQGILYKPQNFDSTKKYPIIFYYYEKLSNNLHVFLTPTLSVGTIDIPWFVSKGYLVFTPDIHYKMGDPGISAYNYVVSAANFMAQKKFVDSTKMGIQGHSFGGYETNFLVTHTNIFAAACAASGNSDLVSLNGTLAGDGSSLQYMMARAQFRLDEIFWDDPDRYIRNSPFYHIKNITTPLLIMHTKLDDVCPYSQAIEFFLGIRRLRKKAWMAIYENEAHVLSQYNNQMDFTLKLDNFFEHFLRNKPMPEWMKNSTTDLK